MEVRLKSESPWRGWRNASIYHEFVETFPIYRELNRFLADLADVGHARRVLDLACGSGATTLACLERLPREAEIVGVDSSAEMLAIARAEIGDRRAHFVLSPARSVDRELPGIFDRCVCNAAVWQFPSLREVFDALSRVLVRDALFVFNVPAERVIGETISIHPFQAALARAIESATELPLVAARRIETAHILEVLEEAGFALEERTEFVYRCRQEELMELMEIPAMIRPLTPGLSGYERQTVLEQARARTDPRQKVEVPWLYYRARRL